MIPLWNQAASRRWKSTFERTVRWMGDFPWAGMAKLGAMFLTAVILLWGAADLYYGSVLRNNLLMLKRDGVPMTMDAILPDPVEDGDNAAIFYHKAMMLILLADGGPLTLVNPDDDDDDSDRFRELERTYASSAFSGEMTALYGREAVTNDPAKYPWPEERGQAIVQAMQSREIQEIYEALEAGAKRPAYDMKLHYEEGFALMLPHLWKMFRLSKMLGFKALVEMQQENPRQAAQTLSTALRMAAHLQQEPIVLSHLVSYAIFLESLPYLRNIVEGYGMPEEGLRLLLATTLSLDYASMQRSLYQAFAYDLQNWIRFHQDLDRGKVFDAVFWEGVLEARGNGGWVFRLYGTWIARPFRKRHLGESLRANRTVFTLLSQPRPRAVAQCADISLRKKSHDALDRFVITPAENSLRQCVRAEAANKIAMIALA